MNIILHNVDLFKQICNQTNVLNAVQFVSKFWPELLLQKIVLEKRNKGILFELINKLAKDYF